MIRKEINADAGCSVVEFKARAAFVCRRRTLPPPPCWNKPNRSSPNHPQALSGARGCRIDRKAVGLLEHFGEPGRLPADRRGVLWVRVAGNQLYPPAALRRTTSVHRGLGPCRRQRRCANRTPWRRNRRCPAPCPTPGPTLPMSIPRLPPVPTCNRSVSAFRAAAKRLSSAGWQFDEVIRTWLYLGDITGMEGRRQR